MEDQAQIDVDLQLQDQLGNDLNNKDYDLNQNITQQLSTDVTIQNSAQIQDNHSTLDPQDSNGEDFSERQPFIQNQQPVESHQKQEEEKKNNIAKSSVRVHPPNQNQDCQNHHIITGLANPYAGKDDMCLNKPGHGHHNHNNFGKIQGMPLYKKRIVNPQYYNQSQLNQIFPPGINRPRCRCGYYWYNQHYGFTIKNQEQTMHFKSQHIEVTVQNSIATIRLTQVFKNELEDAVEATYSFPTDPDIIVSKLQIELGDRIVEGKVMEKQQAREKYDDAIAGGNAAVLVQEKEKNKDLIEMTIGGINPEQKVKVTLEFIKQLEIEGGAYCLRIPTSYFIKTYGEVSELGMRIETPQYPDGKIKKRQPTANYTFRMLIDAQLPISYLSIPNHSKVVRTNHTLPTQVEIEQLEGDAYLMKKDLLVYFRTTQMDKPLLLAQQSPKHPDEVACLVSLVPTFSPPNPQEEIEIVENERPEEQDIIDIKSIDTSKQAFIFIVDRSGSMRGKKMDMTKEALKLFIASLPSGSLFEIISFGGKFNPTSFRGEGFNNTDKEVKNVKQKIDFFLADMGGTNIYNPLDYALNKILSQPQNPFQKKIFLLTDGEIKDPDNVINLARQANSRSVVHTFGIGNGCSKYLVKGLAKAGRGSYSFVEENDNLKAKVIKALKKAVEPSLQGCRFEFPKDCEIQCPRDGLIGEAFRNEITNQYLIMKKSVFENFKIAYSVQNDPIKNCSLFQEYNYEEFKMLEEGETLFKLAAKMMIKELEDNDAKNIGPEIKAEEQKLSIKYQVMCEETAFIGVVKQEDKHSGELKKVLIPTTSSADQRRYQQNQQYNINPPIKMYGMMRCSVPPTYANTSKVSLSSLSSRGVQKREAGLDGQAMLKETSMLTRTSATIKQSLAPKMNDNKAMLGLAKSNTFGIKLEGKSSIIQNNRNKLQMKSSQEESKMKLKSKMQENYEDYDEEEEKGSKPQFRPQSAIIKSKKISKPTSSTTKTLKPTLETLIDAQSSAGMWTDGRTLAVFLASADVNLDKPSSEEVEKAMMEMLNESGMQNMKQVWLTILALFILREKFDHQEDEWSMIAKKAKTYLKNQGITKVEPLFKLINLQLL
eukprot:403362158